LEPRDIVPAKEATRGTLAEGGLASLLGDLQRGRATGWLRLTAMEVRSGIPSVTRCGLRLRGGRVVALEAAEGPLRGAAPAGADLSRRAAAILSRMLPCRDGMQSWEPEPAAGTDAASDAPWLAALAMRAVHEVTDPSAVRWALGELGRRLVPASTVDEQTTPLSPTQGLLLSRLGSGATGVELSEQAANSEMAERDLLALICAGVVAWASDTPPEPMARPASEKPKGASAPAAARRTHAPSTAKSAPAAVSRPTPPAPPPAPQVPDMAALRREIEDAHAALRGATHFAVLGLTPDASEADVRHAFARLARRYHPDAQRDAALADVRQKLVDLFVAVSNAYGVLKDAGERERYERGLGLRDQGGRAPRPATSGARVSGPAGDTADEPIESRLLRAEEALGAAQPWEAIRLLEEAVPAATGSLKVRACVLLGRAYAERERPREAEKALQAALQADPRSVSACLALGRFYRDQGLLKRARGLFERALEIDASQADAMRELSELPDDAPEGPPKGSLLSRLRGERR
jgi:curved DNA-binding protein CbpA